MIETTDMAVYVAVIENGGINGAARQLGIVKSAVSRRVRDLEQNLGAALLERAGNVLRPTEVGVVYYAKCVSILDAIHSANQFASGFNDGIGGKLRVSVSPALCTYVIAPLLAAFSITYPDILIDLEVSQRDLNPNDTDFDVAVRMERQPDSDLLTRTIGRNQILICASPDYLERRGTPTHPSELEQHDGLLHSHDGAAEWTLSEDGESRAFPIRERVRSECRTHLVAAACAGLGLVLTPSFMVADAIAAGRLQVVLREFWPRAGSIAAIYPPSRKRLQKVRALVDFLGDGIPDPCPWDVLIENSHAAA